MDRVAPSLWEADASRNPAARPMPRPRGGPANLAFSPVHRATGRRSRPGLGPAAPVHPSPARRGTAISAIEHASLSSSVGLTPTHPLCRVTSTMDTIDRPDSNVPARYPPGFLPGAGPDRRDVARPGRRVDGAADHAPGPPAGAQPALVADHALAGWWCPLPLAYLIYTLVEPTFEAFEPAPGRADARIDLFDPVRATAGHGRRSSPTS